MRCLGDTTKFTSFSLHYLWTTMMFGVMISSRCQVLIETSGFLFFFCSTKKYKWFLVNGLKHAQTLVGIAPVCPAVVNRDGFAGGTNPACLLLNYRHVFRHFVEAAHYRDCTSQNLAWVLSRKHTLILEERAVCAGAFYWDYQEGWQVIQEFSNVFAQARALLCFEGKHLYVCPPLTIISHEV